MLLLPPLMTREAGWEVRDVTLNHCPEDGEPNKYCLILPILGEQSDLNIDLKLLNTQPSLQIRQPTSKEIRNLPWYELTYLSDWDPYSPFYDEMDHTAKLLCDCWGVQTMTFRTVNNVSILLNHLPSK